MEGNYKMKLTHMDEVIRKNEMLYSAERIYQLYEEIYLGDLKKMFINESKYIEYKWYSIDELDIKKTKEDRNFAETKGNSYLKGMEDKKLLGLDIMKNGTFWPIGVIHNNTHKNEVFKGSHRVLSAKLLQKDGLWDNRKLLAIDYIMPVEDTIWEFYSGYRKFEGDNMYKIPILILYPDVNISTVDWDLIENDINLHGGKMIDHDVAEIPLQGHRFLVKTLAYTSIWLNELICFRRDMTGEFLKPSNIINSEEAFEKWIKEDN